MSGHGPHDDGSKQTPAAWQEDQTPTGWQDGESPDPDDLPWTIAPTSVPPDTTAGEELSTIEATVQMPALRPPAASGRTENSEASTEAATSVPRRPTDDATVLIPRDPSGARHGGRRRRGDAAKRAVARAIGIAKVSYTRTASSDGDKDSGKPAAPAPIVHTGGSVVAVFAILGLLILSGIAAMYFKPKDNSPSAPQPTPSPVRQTTASSPSPSESPSPSLVPSPSPSTPPATPPKSPATSPKRSTAPPTSPPQTLSSDITAARYGDCFVNSGGNTSPNLQKVACRPGSLRLVYRFDGTLDLNRCPNSTPNRFLFEVTGDKPMKFVLCMRPV